jgi:hypothetical protein
VVRRAALVHDLGRLGVSNSIWDKQAALSHSELERVRLDPYLTERLSRGGARRRGRSGQYTARLAGGPELARLLQKAYTQTPRHADEPQSYTD